MRWVAMLTAGTVVLGLCACRVTPPPPPPGYFGPTLTLEQLVDGVNRNNDRLPALWARQRFQATIVDPDKKKATRIDGYGNLLFTAPNQMKLTAQNEVADLFEMGCDGRQFWLYEIRDKQFWWGNLSDAAGDDSADIPVRPEMVMEILGIRRLDKSLLAQPTPVLRFNNAADAYMVDWQIQSAGHWAATKEVWYDRQTLLPRRVLLFDALGRVVLWARLSNDATVEVPGEARSSWPSIATHFDLFFPYTRSRMTFDLTDMTLSHHGFPKPASYRMPDPNLLSESGVRVNQIDEATGH